MEFTTDSNMRITMKNPRILKQSHTTSSGQLDTFQKTKNTALSVLPGLGRNGMPDHRTIVTALSGRSTMSWTLSSCNSGSCGSLY